jgi:hypothetical protein
MTMSMYSTYSPDQELHQEDIFGKILLSIKIIPIINFQFHFS